MELAIVIAIVIVVVLIVHFSDFIPRKNKIKYLNCKYLNLFIDLI